MARARLAHELLALSLRGSAEQILRDGGVVGERHHFDNKLAFAILRRLDRRAELGATFRTPPARDIPAPPPAVSGEWQPLLDALSEERGEDASRLLTPLPIEGDKGDEGNDSPIEACEDDMDNFDHPRIWRIWDTKEWRTNYPPPPDFAGHEEGDWEDEGYCRALGDHELAALIAAGIAEPSDIESEISIQQDEAERDAFFAALAAERSEAIAQQSLAASKDGEGRPASHGED